MKKLTSTFHGNTESLSFIPEPVAHRDPAVFKDNSSGGMRVPAELVLIFAEG